MRNFEFKKNNFDLIRLMAALQVAIVHGYEHFEIENGRIFIDFISIFPGVPIFFVISGFLISASWERSSSVPSYIQNRILRIYPALWGCLIFSVLTVLAVYQIDVSIVEFSKWIIAQVSIGQFYNPEFLRGYGVGVLNGSLWTIPVELQFYLLLPLIYILIDKVDWKAGFLIAFLLILVTINQLYIGVKGSEKIYIKLFGVSVLPYLYMFMIGVILQRNLLFVRKFLANKAMYWLTLYLVFVTISSLLGFKYKGNYLNPVLAILISFLTISFSYSYTFKLGNILKGNDISYGVYIYHMIIVNFLLHVQTFSPEINLIIMLVCTLIVALTSWRVIEKPALSFKKYSVRISKDNKAIQRTP